MSNCAIVGINWGDEGKGRMVDYLTQQYDVVVRYQGGGNAGHTVINEKGKFALHLLPSGIFRSGVMNILGNGVALDCENLLKEIDTVRQGGVDITPENLLVSERASLLLPWHRELDALEEQRLKDKKYGSTKQGIAPFYSDKYQKKTKTLWKASSRRPPTTTLCSSPTSARFTSSKGTKFPRRPGTPAGARSSIFCNSIPAKRSRRSFPCPNAAKAI